MAVSTKKGSKSTKAKPRRPAVKKSRPRRKQDHSLQSQLAEALEQQAATSEILRMIARSPGDLQSILDATAANAAKLCDAVDAAVWRIDGDVLRLAAHFGSVPMLHGIGDSDSIDRETATGRAIVERQTIHVHDLVAAQDEFPRAKTRGAITGTRTALAAPLLRDGNVIGAIHIRRTEVRPFTNRQVKVLEPSPIRPSLPLRTRGFSRSVRPEPRAFSTLRRDCRRQSVVRNQTSPRRSCQKNYRNFQFRFSEYFSFR